MASSWDRAAWLLARQPELHASQIARRCEISEYLLELWRADAKFIRLVEEMKKYTPELRNGVAKLLGTTDLGQRDIAFLARVPQTQISRWARDPEFQQLIAHHRRRAVAMKDKDVEDDDGEWSPVITTFNYKKPSGGR